MTQCVFSFSVIFILLSLLQLSETQQTNSLQCPCYIIPSTGECLQYDARLQASTLDEAMNTFSDLTMGDSPAVAAAVPQMADKECQTEECKICKEYLKNKLKKIGMLPPSTITSITANSTAYCGKYNFVKQKHEEDDDDSDEDSNDDNDDDDDKDEKSKSKVYEKYLEALKKSLPKFEKDKKEWKDYHRIRRQANADTTVVGTRFNLSCEKRGVATDGSGMLVLCSRCWVWRELPENYYPRYMNELICDDVDNACLSGYASCGISHRSAYVVRNDSGVINVVTLQAGSFCECRVQTGTALESLVTGVQGNALPTLPPLTGGQSAQTPQSAPSNVAPPSFWY